MDTLLTIPVFWQSGLAFVVGLVVGAGVCILLLRTKGQNAQLQGQISKLEAELENYRSRINEHFSTTAQMINQLTEQYRDIHQHLASGAGDLCADHKVKEQFQDALICASSIPDSNEKSSETGKISSSPPKDYASEEKKSVVVR